MDSKGLDIGLCIECGLPADILSRTVLESTDGPIEHVATRCLGGHVLRCPAGWVGPERKNPPA